VAAPDRGPAARVGAERRPGPWAGVRGAAAVGAGPPGPQALVVAVEPHSRLTAGPAPAGLTEAVRRAVRPVTPGVQVAAVLVTRTMPVDVRHNSKVDRARLARWADRVLAGGRVGRP